MGRTLKIGIYSPFFGSAMGGGEKYLGVTAEALRAAYPQHRIDMITRVPIDRERYERTLNLDLSGLNFVLPRYERSGLLSRIPTLRLYRDMFRLIDAIAYTKHYDLFIAMVYVLPVFSRARLNVMLCQFPYRPMPHPTRIPRTVFNIYAFPYRVVRRLFMPHDVRSFQRIICQSQYVRTWVGRYWHRDALVVNPPIDIPEQAPNWGLKQNIILSVGRFFRGGHQKRHDVMARAFRDLCDAGLHGWELHMVGSVDRTEEHRGYYESIEQLSQGYPIVLHPDASHAELEDLYRRAPIYWHAAGFQADASDPALLEHFGMTTAEAMAYGAVPVAIASGGQVEVVRDGIDGFLWNSPDELKQRTLQLVENPELRKAMGEQARASAQKLSRHRFKREIVDAIAPVIAEVDSIQ